MKKVRLKNLVLVMMFLLLSSVGFSGLIIENFDSKEGFEKSAEGTIELYISTSGYENKCLRMFYDITTGSWVQFYKDYSVQNWSGGDTLKFWFKGSGANNNLEIKLVDKDGSVFIKTLSNVTNTNSSWVKLEIPLSNFSYGWGGDDNVLDKTKIKTISFGVTKSEGSNGYLVIDNIVLHLSTPTVKVLDNFDDLNSTNNFSGTNYTLNNCSVAYISTVTYAGSGAAEISYSVFSSTVDSYAYFLLPLGNNDISDTTHLSFYVKGATGDEQFKLKFETGFWNSKELPISNYIDLSTDWQKVEIPLSDFGELLKSTDSMKLTFVFGYNFGGVKNSKIYVDEIKFLVPGAAGTDVKVIDSMDDLTGGSKLSSWAKVGDAVKSLQLVDGVSGTGDKSDKAIMLNYDFTSAKDSWALMERNLSLNFCYYTHLQFKYKGDVKGNNLEIKLTDSDETTYWKKIFSVSSSTDWQTIKIPLKEFSFFSKNKYNLDSNMNLNLKGITTIWVALSKGSSVSGENKGNVYFDQLELIQEPEFQTQSGTIESFKVTNNPFSPNSDGIKDKITFSYKLKDFAEVKLEIYNLRGELLKTFNEGEKQTGQEFSIEWDGKDSDNKLLKNGLYIYRFVIKTLDGKQEEIKNVVGIVK